MRTFKICVFIALAILIATACSTESTPVYQLTTSAEPSEAGSVTQSATEIEEGETITITANANEGWEFSSWNGDFSGSYNPASLSMHSDKSITALFSKKEYPLGVIVIGEGTVDEKIVQQKSSDYSHGTLVELTANPSEGWEFVEWGGMNDKHINPQEILIDGLKTVFANFNQIKYTLTINVEGEGSVEKEAIQPKTTEYTSDTEVRLIAIPEKGWRFIKWSGDIENTSEQVTITLDEDKSVTAFFEPVYHNLIVNIEGEGSVEQEVTQSKATEYLSETEVRLTANPASEWEFLKWSGDIENTSEQVTITLDEDKSVTAAFTNEIPKLRTVNPQLIDPYKVEIVGEILETYGQEVISKQFCLSTEEYPDENDIKYRASSSNNLYYFSVIGNLEQDTNYYIRACAIFYSEENDQSKYRYGNQIQFKTKKVAIRGGGLTDIDGNQYETVILGRQEWMAENLRTSSYANGDDIPQITDPSIFGAASTGVWSYYKGDESYDEIYGKYYNWYAVDSDKGLCPSGWIMPYQGHWRALINYLGGSYKAGGRMKSTDYWRSPNAGATNESLMNIVPSGNFNYGLGEFATFYTLSLVFPEDTVNLFYGYTASYNSGNMKLGHVGGTGYSVRCFKYID